MLAVVATCVSAPLFFDDYANIPVPQIQVGLHEWASGYEGTSSWSIDSASPLYEDHIANFESLKVKIGPLKFHELLVKLLKACRYVLCFRLYRFLTCCL